MEYLRNDKSSTLHSGFRTSAERLPVLIYICSDFFSFRKENTVITA
jgi:hypothetical protein